MEMTLEGYQNGDAVLRDLQLSKKVDLRAGRVIFAVPRQLKSVRAVFEMDGLARYCWGCSIFPCSLYRH